MEYVKISKVTDFEETTMKTYRIMARRVAILKDSQGAFRAMEYACRHEGADLSGGRIDGHIVTCPWHAWRYNIQTGECVWGAQTKLRPYGLKIEGNDIFVTLHPVE